MIGHQVTKRVTVVSDRGIGQENVPSQAILRAMATIDWGGFSYAKIL